jgi:YD repeat-containing protein
MRRATVAARLVLAISSLCLASVASATETITYTYDAKGRLVKVERAGSINNGVTTTYAHDRADNRSNLTVTGSTNGGSGGGSAVVVDGSFEDPPQNGGYTYGPTITGATFTGGAGVAGNGSAWGFAAAPEGTQVAFLQQQATIALTVTGLTPGTAYVVRFSIVQRPGYPGNPVTVSFAGTGLGTFTPASTAFTQVTTASFTASAATGTVTFSTPASSTDIATGLDAVSIVPAP